MAHPAQQFAVPISAERGGIFIMGQATLSRWVRTGMSSSRQDLSVRGGESAHDAAPGCGARGRVDDEPVAHLLRPGHRVAELEIQHARLTLETRRALCQRLRRTDDEQSPRAARESRTWRVVAHTAKGLEAPSSGSSPRTVSAGEY